MGHHPGMGTQATPTPSAGSLVQAILGLEFGASEGAGNRLAIDGLALAPQGNGATELRIARLEVAGLRMASGPFALEAGRLVLHGIVAQAGGTDGAPELRALQAADAELADVVVSGPVVLPQRSVGAQPATAWRLEPLATAGGVLRAQIVDAHLMFDANVMVPVRQGGIDFNAATVEHVGPDSRMGVSRLGIYVDAANGRSYLYQFPGTTVAGVEYERGPALGPWMSDRGKLQLQPFAESQLQQLLGGGGLGVTGQARMLLGRTAVQGELQLGDGTVAMPGLSAELRGSAEGSNRVRLHSQAVGRGITAEIGALAVQQAMVQLAGLRMVIGKASGAAVLELAIADGQLRFAARLPALKAAGLQLQQASEQISSR